MIFWIENPIGETDRRVPREKKERPIKGGINTYHKKSIVEKRVREEKYVLLSDQT
jgi:hypothetical protein